MNFIKVNENIYGQMAKFTLGKCLGCLSFEEGKLSLEFG